MFQVFPYVYFLHFTHIIFLASIVQRYFSLPHSLVRSYIIVNYVSLSLMISVFIDAFFKVRRVREKEEREKSAEGECV